MESSAAIALFTQVILSVPLLIIKLDNEAPFIPFLILPNIIRLPVPLIVKFEPDLNLIPAPSKSDEVSFFSLSIIVDFPFKINFTSQFFFITKGPVFELSMFIELNVIVGDVPFLTSMPHSLQVPLMV